MARFLGANFLFSLKTHKIAKNSVWGKGFMGVAMAFLSKRGLARLFRTLRRKRRLNSHIIDNFIMGVIIVNSITLGMETSPYLMAKFGPLLKLIDHIALAIFTFEIGVKMLINRWRYFRDPWNVFDFLIVGASLLTFIPKLSMLRSLRILRIFLLISFMPRLRFIVQSLLLSLPGIFGISVLLLVMFYVCGVLATQFFGNVTPENFGTLGLSLYSLFRIMTLDGSWDIVDPVVADNPYAYIFFIPFMLFSAYIIMNIFIAIIINGMREARLKNEEKERTAQLAAEIDASEKRSETALEAIMSKLNEIDGRLAHMEGREKNG